VATAALIVSLELLTREHVPEITCRLVLDFRLAPYVHCTSLEQSEERRGKAIIAVPRKFWESSSDTQGQRGCSLTSQMLYSPRADLFTSE